MTGVPQYSPDDGVRLDFLAHSLQKVLFGLIVVILAGNLPALLLLLPAQEGVSPAQDLLERYQLWYLVMLAVVCGSILWTVIGLVRAIVQLKQHSYDPGSLVIALPLTVELLIVPGIILYMAVSTGIPRYFIWAGQDLRQIQAGQLEQVTGLLGAKRYEMAFPGDISGERPLTRCPVMGADTGGAWLILGQPKGLPFAPQQVWDAEQSTAWNLEHGQWYCLSYTSRLHLVVEAEPVGGAAP